jgi:hypothetical protein
MAIASIKHAVSNPQPQADDLPLPPARSNDTAIADGDADEGNAAVNKNNASDKLPPEYQLHEVDLTNPDMDPLEYTFRRFVPIPKVYFWDTADESNYFNQNLPLRVKLWHNSIYYLGLCLKKAEAAGEIVANILGLNSGEFDYVTNTMTEEQWSESRRNVEARRQESRRHQEEREERERVERGEEEVVSDVGLSSRNVL